MDQKEIYKYLPHRYPMLMVDDIYEVEYGKYIRGVKCISRNEPWAQGHFPEEAIFPGVLIVETMAQICGFIFYNKNEEGVGLKSYLTKIEDMKFIKHVLPGSQLIVEGELVQKFGKYVKINAKASIDNKVVAKGKLSYYLASDFEVEEDE